MGKIKIEGYLCERCKHKWVARNVENPRVCPRCHSPWWDKPKKKRGKFLKKFKNDK